MLELPNVEADTLEPSKHIGVANEKPKGRVFEGVDKDAISVKLPNPDAIEPPDAGASKADVELA